jgi:hypothetical protein
VPFFEHIFDRGEPLHLFIISHVQYGRKGVAHAFASERRGQPPLLERLRITRILNSEQFPKGILVKKTILICQPRTKTRGCSAILWAALTLVYAAPEFAQVNQSQGPNQATLHTAQLESLVSPIAAYPDSLVHQVRFRGSGFRRGGFRGRGFRGGGFRGGGFRGGGFHGNPHHFRGRRFRR